MIIIEPCIDCDNITIDIVIKQINLINAKKELYMSYIKNLDEELECIKFTYFV